MDLMGKASCSVSAVQILEFAYIVIARVIRGAVSACQARCVPYRAIFLFPWVSFYNCPHDHPPRHTGTARGPSLGTRCVSRPRRASGAHHRSTRDRRDHAPMPWHPRMAMAWGGMGWVIGWVPEGTFVICALFSIRRCFGFHSSNV
jgi:hypothetical protein